MEFEQIEKNLKHKKRTIRDFVKTLENSIDKTPVHAFLFGAGCSISSGIKSANQLIEEWRESIFQSIFPDFTDYNPEISKQKLRETCNDWYNEKYEYSILFERMYSLPAQRRAYIEKLVSGAFPSIGYLYYLRLVEEHFIDTVFTTNFDDLVNESFYLFSDLRPMVCAHDSTIKSLLVTSKRPKIIKLHGDYLFEDIKNTLRETESLENNMRDKFIEFCKCYGLVVLGYSGADRSILDILYFLLKNDDYLKNGLYWCIRKGDSISDDVVQLLHNEKAFYIEIDGFDEFFCEVHSLILKQSLDVSNSFITDENEVKIKKILENTRIENTKSALLTEEISKLKKRKKNNSLDKIIKDLSDGDEKKKKNNLVLSDQVLLYKFYEDLNQYNFDPLIQNINKELEKENLDKVMEIELLILLVRTFRDQNNIKSAISAAERLIHKDEYNINSYQLYLSVENDLFKAIKTLDNAIQKNLYSPRLYYLKAKLLNRIRKHNIIPKDYDKEVKIEKIEEILEKGQNCDLGFGNPCWNYRFDLLTSEYEKNKSLKKEISQAKTLLDSYEKQNPKSLSVVSKKVRLMCLEKCNYEDINRYILDNRIDDPDLSDEYLLLDLTALAELDEKDKLRNRIEEISSDHENEDVIFQKAYYLVDFFNEVDNSINILRSYLDKHDESSKIMNLLFDFYLIKNDFSNADKIINEIEIKRRKKLRLDLSSKKNEWDSVLHLNDELSKTEKGNISYLASKSHALLYQKKYQDVIDLLTTPLSNANFQIGDDVLLTNYDLAYYKIKNGKTKPPRNRIDTITKYSTNKLARTAYYIMDKDFTNAYKSYLSFIDGSFINYYNSIDSYFLNDFLDEKNQQIFRKAITEIHTT